MNEKEAVVKLEKENNDVLVNYHAGDSAGDTIITKICLRWWRNGTIKSSVPTELETIWKLQNIQKLELFWLPYHSIQSIGAGIGIGNLSNSLEEFSLDGCRNLLELPPEIGLLVNLTSFKIIDCPLVHRLPSEIGNLTSLTTFAIRKCIQLTCLPPELGNLTSLQELEIDDNESLHCIPAEIGNIDSLKILKIAHNEQLQIIRTEIGESMGLRLEWSLMTNIPLAICSLEGLRELNIDCCDNLTVIPPEIGNLKKLLKLKISRCNNLGTLPKEVGDINKLEELIIDLCASLTHLPTELGNLKCLQKLGIGDCSNLEDLPPSIGNIGGSLQEVSITDCDRLEKFPPEISKCKNLRLLKISYDNEDHLKNFLSKVSANFNRLQEMKIILYFDVECLPPEISNLRCLQKLLISVHYDLNHLCPEIGCLERLEELEINSGGVWQSLPAEIGELKSLRKLVITGHSPPLQSIPLEMGNLKNLQELDLTYYCGCLERLSLVINNLKGLREMYIAYDPYYSRTETDSIISPWSAKLNFEFSLEHFSFQYAHFSPDLNIFLQHIAAEPSELSPMSLLLHKNIRCFDFDCVELKELDKDIIFKLLQKYPKLGRIRKCPRGELGFLTVEMLHLLYFNRFGRSLQVEVSTNGNGSVPSIFTEKVWPIVLEEAQQRIQKDI